MAEQQDNRVGKKNYSVLFRSKIMKHYKTVETVIKKHEEIDHITCDICGKKGDRSGNWSDREYHLAETEISMDKGKGYPEGGYGTRTVVHLCPECFADKLIPWLKTQGVEPTKEEYDY